jgi:hypothetical protein
MRGLLLCFLLLPFLGYGQNIGLHPPEVDWQKLRTEQGRIIFPTGYADRAQRVAGLIDLLATETTRSIGEKLYDIDLILQTPNMTVNGYVGLGPFRSEFYVTPPQSFSLLSQTGWVDLLTIHEFRHVQQISNERRGLTNLASVLQGQVGWSVLSNIAVPNWFSEGDAVIAETAFTSAGRGRTPAFSGDFRALLGRNRFYSYAKARNGSFRDLVPDHYRYGYAMLTYARERFGNDVWRRVLHEGAAFRSPFYSFSRALKRATGLTTKELYFSTLVELERLQDSSLRARAPLVGGLPVTRGDDDIRAYRFPFTDGAGRLLALRTSYRQLPALVEVGEPDRVITRVGIQREPWLDGGNRFVLWTEYRQDPRYTNQSYSEIVRYELRSGRKEVLTERGHYLSASLSPDKRRIVAVYYDPLASGPELHLLDAATGAVVLRKTFAENTAVSWPRFSPDGSLIYFFGQTRAGVSIEAWDTEGGSVRTVRATSREPIDMLAVTQTGHLLFTNGRSGIDNVHRLDPATGEEQQLTNVRVGAYYPQLIGSTLHYSAPTPRGERLHLLTLVPGEEPEVRMLPTAPSFFERTEAFVAEARDLTAAVESANYPVENFSNTLGGIRLHSWSFNGSYVTPGLEIDFANALNTAEVTLAGLYNINEDRYSGGLTATYGGFFPVIELSGRYRDRNYFVQQDRRDSLRFFRQEFSQLSVGGSVRLPFEWVNGNFITTLVPSLGYQYVSQRGTESGELPESFGNLAGGLTFNVLRRTAIRQVQPRWGVTVSADYDRALGDSKPGERLLLRSSVYVPGMFLTHGIRLDADLQYEQAENLYQFPEIFRYARGFAAPLNDRVYRLGVNYQLPLLYPDFGILGITYFKRIRLNGFYDYSRYRIDAFDAEFREQSVGGQLFFDNVWLNTQDLTVGMELAYRLDEDIFSADDNDIQFRLLLSGAF